MDIAAWLKGLGLEQYEAAFRENAVDAEVLPELTAEDLNDLGVVLVGHRRKLLAAIAALKGPLVPGAAMAADVCVPALAAARSAISAPVSSAERRQLTVMFVDMVGSTALSAQMDPEDLRDVIGAFHRCVAEAVSRYDGFVAKYMGDGVLVYFGYPQAHEDDAERAVRTGLALIEAVEQLKAREQLQVRIGIATGLVVVGDLIGSGEAQERGVVGETPNLAARLQAVAEPNSVVIAVSTRQRIGDLFEYDDLGPLKVKGYAEPMGAWRVRGESSVESRYEALHPTALPPLVGREKEIEVLLRRWEQAQSGHGRVVLLSGEPGIGKSRITAAVQERIEHEPHVRVRHFCSPYHADSALHPFIVQLERAAGFERQDAPDTKLDKLAALLAPASPPEDVTLLAELLSIPTRDRYLPLSLTPQRQKERTFEALLRQLESLARQRPVLLIFEDVHWIDPTSLELLDLTIERVRRLPVLLLVTFRPEFQPPWTGQSHVTALALTRLDHRDGAALVAQIAGHAVLPEDLVEEIAERTDGVPLFVEELTKVVLEASVDGRAATRALSMASSAALAVPATLHASLMARLDRLGPAAKDVAQTGAAIGREFSYELLAAVDQRTETELQTALAQLAEAGLVFCRGLPPRAAYLFKHALVQDAAYSTLLRDRRQLLHARVASVLEKSLPDAVETQPELLAHHFTEAGLVEPAIRYWRMAGARARKRSADVEAARHLSRALALVGSLPETRERDELELDLCIETGGALIASRGYGAAECRELHARARALCDRLGDTTKLFPVLYGQWVYEHANGRFTTSLGIAEQFLDQAKCAGDRALTMIGHRQVGFTFLLRGRADLALPHLHGSLSAYDPSQDASLAYVYGQNPRVGSVMGAGFALGCLGFPEQADRLVRQSVEEAHTLAHSHTLAWAQWHASLFHLLRRDPASAEVAAELVVAIAGEHGGVFWAAMGPLLLSCARAARSMSDNDVAQLRQNLEATHRLTWWGVFRPYIDVLAANILGATGDRVGGLQLLEEARPFIEEWEQRLPEAEYYRVRANLLLATGADPSEVETHLVRAGEVARVQSSKLFELRAAIGLAKLWRDQGQRERAHDLVEPISGWFTEGLDTPDLKEAKALLGELRA